MRPQGIGKFIILAGAFLVFLGLLLIFWQRIPFLGKLPGDIFVQGENFRFFFPLMTCLVISVLLTIVLNFIFRLFR
ncbi:MAG: DUF2905 domain-containing protein [Chloroflexota bacterium]|nr:DUF2905 domain-containing protein [Chloroflexota bacterium]